jgi:hypothetical protein
VSQPSEIGGCQGVFKEAGLPNRIIHLQPVKSPNLFPAKLQNRQNKTKLILLIVWGGQLANRE